MNTFLICRNVYKMSNWYSSLILWLPQGAMELFLWKNRKIEIIVDFSEFKNLNSSVSSHRYMYLLKKCLW